MNIICNFTECSPNSYQASNKIAKWLSGLLEYNLIDTKEKAKFLLDNNIKIEKVVLMSGVPLYCNFFKELVEIITKADKLISVCNDYKTKLPSIIKKIPNLNWVGIASHSPDEDSPTSYRIDLNKLLSTNKIPATDYEVEGLFYYGAYRENRIKNFERYLKPSHLNISISTGKKNVDKFQEISPNATYYTTSSDIMTILPKFQSTLYIEDIVKKNISFSPANRFYEAISSKTLMFYDRQTKPTLELAGVWDEDFAVSSQEEIKEKLKNYEYLRLKQINQFIDRDFKVELNNDMKKIIQLL